jgi:hypothetical protein
MVDPFGFLSKEKWSLVFFYGGFVRKKKKKKTKVELFWRVVILGQIERVGF